MTSKRITVSRKRLLCVLLLVASASAATGTGTMAYFSDSETSVDNRVASGTLDLELNGTDQHVNFLNESAIKPGDNGTQSVVLGNTGSINGTLEIVIVGVNDSENGFTSNEKSRDSSKETGELQKYVEIRGSIDGTPITPWASLANVSQVAPHTYEPDTVIAAKSTRTFAIEWRFNDPGRKGVNEAQSDSAELEVTFRLVQSEGG